MAESTATRYTVSDLPVLSSAAATDLFLSQDTEGVAHKVTGDQLKEYVDNPSTYQVNSIDFTLTATEYANLCTALGISAE